MKDHPALAVSCERCGAIPAAPCRRRRKSSANVEERQIPHNERRWRYARALDDPAWWQVARDGLEPFVLRVPVQA